MLSPKEITDREHKAYNSRATRFFGTAFADLIGFNVLSSTSMLISGASVWPLIGVGLMAYPLTYAPWALLGQGLRELMCTSHPFARMPTLFLFNASMTLLTVWIGLAIVASFTAMAFNPFTLPCLIGVAVAAAIVFAASVAVALRTRYVTPNGPMPVSLGRELLQALDPFKSRPFDYHKADESHDTGLYVRPFYVKEKAEADHTIWGIFGKINTQQSPTSAQNAPTPSFAGTVREQGGIQP